MTPTEIKKEDLEGLPSETHRSLRVLGTIICLIAVTGHIWSEILFKKAEADFKDALGEEYVKRMPELTQFTLKAHSSPLWPLGTWIPAAALLFIWMLRQGWLVGLLSGVILLWTVAFLCVMPLSFWFGDKMILYGIKEKSKKPDFLKRVMDL